METGRVHVRIGLVLSAGGLRGAGHLGVLRKIIHHGIPIDVIVGCSAGAIVAAYYAAVGLSLEEMIADGQSFRARHLLAHSLNVRLRQRLGSLVEPLSGVIPERLRQLETASFDRLHHGIKALGIVCHDRATGYGRYFSTGNSHGASLCDVVRASASIPFLLPPVAVTCGEQRALLTDGGVSDSLPLAFAQRPPLGATHLIASDCRWFHARPPLAEHIVYIQPRLPGTGTLWAPRSTLLRTVQQGEEAVTDDLVRRIRWWLKQPVGSPPRRLPASQAARSATVV